MTEVGAAWRGNGVVGRGKSGEKWTGLRSRWARKHVIFRNPLGKSGSGEDRTGH